MHEVAHLKTRGIHAKKKGIYASFATVKRLYYSTRPKLSTRSYLHQQSAASEKDRRNVAYQLGVSFYNLATQLGYVDGVYCDSFQSSSELSNNVRVHRTKLGADIQHVPLHVLHLQSYPSILDDILQLIHESY